MNDGALTEESDVEAHNCQKAKRAWEFYSESGTVGMDKTNDLCNVGEILDQANFRNVLGFGNVVLQKNYRLKGGKL